jgi:hypothetical protein
VNEFDCEIDIEWVHGGNLFRMTCSNFTYDDFDRIKLFLYLPLSLDGKHESWVELQTNESFAPDFWDIPMEKANDEWDEARREFSAAWSNDNSGY